MHVAATAEEPLGVVDVVGLEPLPGALRRPNWGCGDQEAGSCFRIDCSRASISGAGSIPSSWVSTARSWRKERSASPWAPVWYCASARTPSGARATARRAPWRGRASTSADDRCAAARRRTSPRPRDAARRDACLTPGRCPVGEVRERDPRHSAAPVEHEGDPVALAEREELTGARHQSSNSRASTVSAGTIRA